MVRMGASMVVVSTFVATAMFAALVVVLAMMRVIAVVGFADIRHSFVPVVATCMPVAAVAIENGLWIIGWNNRVGTAIVQGPVEPGWIWGASGNRDAAGKAVARTVVRFVGRGGACNCNTG